MKALGAYRLLAAALLASIALHVFLIYVLPVLREARQMLLLPPLSARLAKAPEPEARPKPEEPVPAAKSAKRSVPAVKTPTPVPAIAPTVPLAEPEKQSTAKSEPTPAMALPAQPAAAPAPAPAQEPGTVAQYRLALMENMRRDKAYPRIARENGWEGRVRIRVAIGPEGAIAALEVLGGAGYEVLDRRALDMVSSAQPRTPVPAVLRGREFAFEVPVIFSLKDAR